MADAVVKLIAKSDYPQVLRIERRSFHEPWDEGRLCNFMDEFGHFGLVLKEGRVIRGYVFYKYGRGHVRIVNIAVDALERRHGVGRQLLLTIMSDLTQRRSRIILDVNDTNLEAHLFLRACGFTGSMGGHDTYQFEYNLKAGVLR